jgi:hypothetical protein
MVISSWHRHNQLHTLEPVHRLGHTSSSGHLHKPLILAEQQVKATTTCSHTTYFRTDTLRHTCPALDSLFSCA